MENKQEFIRDICKVIPMSKSEAKSRLDLIIHQALAEDRERVRGEIEGVIGLKYKLFGAAGCSRDEEIKEELREAKDPRTVLDRFSSLTINGVGFAGSGGNWDTELLLPDTVFQYTEDILGRKVYQTIRNKE